MAQFVVRVEKMVDYINDVMNSMESEGVYKRMQMKVFSRVYKSKMNSLFVLIRRKLFSYIKDEGDAYFVAIEKGTKEHCLAQKRAFENFILADERELSSEKEYAKFMNDRIVMKIIRTLKRGITKTKSSAIKSALGGGDVLSFFNMIGISVSWKVED